MPSVDTLRRGEFVAIARGAGMPDEAIVGALARKLRSDRRKTLDRWQMTYETFVVRANHLEAHASGHLEAFHRGAIKAWELPAAVRIQVWQTASKSRRLPHRDGPARKAATDALRGLVGVDGQLRDAARAAGARRWGKIGENQARQLVAADQHPHRALAWVEAELAGLQQRAVAVPAARRSGAQIPLAEALWQREDEIDAAIAERVADLLKVADVIRQMPLYLAEDEPEKLGLLRDAVAVYVNDVVDANEQKHRRLSAKQSVEAVVELAEGSAGVRQHARDIVGDRWQELVHDVARQELSRCP